MPYDTDFRCSLFCFYIKPQLGGQPHAGGRCCSLFCFYIKPQRAEGFNRRHSVVPYSVSTSNHNINHAGTIVPPVVPYSVSTSNHNAYLGDANLGGLFLILFLHQTTTKSYRRYNHNGLFLILFLHQTTTLQAGPVGDRLLFLILFLHQTTT